ncbi:MULTISPECIES: S8 family serine peptidase [Legionella]|uniref:Serine metalloprotease n=1 Tax=Legionella drozanskii LLAP-1 TaxID=1212489 RepID=A0A0W0SSV2_9GAMM|nr:MULTISPECIES: S8 family serine peptidase [Legionella]KTC86053.1 serine metalloprotease [Legionella drozanskii LLAP-1]PJE10566.1 MAG: serine metalloprotease [Legionella sp.]
MSYQIGIAGLMCLLATQGFTAEESVQIIIKYKKTPTLATLKAQLSQTANLPFEHLTAIAGGAFVASFDGKKLQRTEEKMDATSIVLEELRKNPNVLYALKDRKGYFKPLVNPPLNEEGAFISHESQWNEFAAPGGVRLESAAGLADGAWAYTHGLATPPVVVAVLDTGIALHSSLMNTFMKNDEGKVWGWNFAANNEDVLDETRTYHGTHVAGIIAAYSDMMLGVGHHLKILPIKIPDATGMFYESQVINALYWSVGGSVPGVPENPYPAKIINMSFGVDREPGKEIEHCDLALQEALHFVRRHGAVITVAAGNENRWEHYNAPAVCNDTIKVAATGLEGLRAYYSNYGPGVSFAAPGGDLMYGRQGGVLSTVNPGGGYQNSGYDFYQGTSMAAPHAAGVAGLVYAVSQNDITPEKVEQLLYTTTHSFKETVDSNNSCVGSKPCGSGILDAENAVKAAMARYDTVFTVPTLSKKALEPCGENSFQPRLKSKLAANNAQWLQIKTACQNETKFALPRLQRVKGKIVATYGAVSYRLDDSQFKLCQIIGDKGVGCYF